ncbi:MAG: formimidoylglutamate deiminase [Myxococcales bacterium]|nr:formimidoylglutamate deiminase [Myxococcales bacterium]
METTASGARRMVLPGLVSAHSHAFQRALRGKTQRTAKDTGTFWSWREAMYAQATALDPESIYRISRVAFDELRASGVVAVGEFHYIQHQADGTPYDDRTLLADTVIAAALDAGLYVTLLRVAYFRAGAGRDAEPGQRRFCDPDVELVLRDVDALRSKYRGHARVRIGVAPHSVRAVPKEWVRECAAYAKKHAMPLHMHVSEVQGEVDECLAEHGVRPMELIASVDGLSDRFVAVHGTNLSEPEAALLGGAKGFVCACPTTERDLGDGLAPIATLRDRGVRLCVGIDSHIVTDGIEELRALETHERLRLRRRVTFEPTVASTPAEQLWLEGSEHGARAIGFDPNELPKTTIELDQPALALVEDRFALDAIVYGGNGLRAEVTAR